MKVEIFPNGDILVHASLHDDFGKTDRGNRRIVEGNWEKFNVSNLVANHELNLKLVAVLKEKKK